MRTKKSRWRSAVLYFVIFFWLAFTVSLTVWWYVFSQRQIDRLLLLDHAAASDFVRDQSMLFWEGATLVFCLLAGGAALAYYTFRLVRQSEQIREFFLTFSHELKTPLASLRLQAETLVEDLEDAEQSELAKRIVDHRARLSLQLDNSLFLANLNPKEMFLEEISVKDVLSSLSKRWPELQIETTGDELVRADTRALESILSNIIQNSVVHGKAEKLTFDMSRSPGESLVDICALDNGKSFSGDTSRLGKLFARHYSGSGNGVGLYLCKRLAELMQGRAECSALEEGFCVRISLPGAKA